jgi:hypothetical protein
MVDVPETPGNRISRRQALRRAAVAGAVAWTVPAVQTINMSRAFAQTQMSQPLVCSWFRITAGEQTVGGGGSGVCGPPSASDSCLSSVGAGDCAPVLGTPSAPAGAGWSACLAAGYLVQEVALTDAAGNCWRSPVSASDPQVGDPVQNGGGGAWAGWSAAGGCLYLPQPTDGVGSPVGVAHVDVMACADPEVAARLNSSSTPTTASTPTTSTSPSTTNGPTSPSPQGLPAPEGSPTVTGPTGPGPTGPTASMPSP